MKTATQSCLEIPENKYIFNEESLPSKPHKEHYGLIDVQSFLNREFQSKYHISALDHHSEYHVQLSNDKLSFHPSITDSIFLHQNNIKHFFEWGNCSLREDYFFLQNLLNHQTGLEINISRGKKQVLNIDLEMSVSNQKVNLSFICLNVQESAEAVINIHAYNRSQLESVWNAISTSHLAPNARLKVNIFQNFSDNNQLIHHWVGFCERDAHLEVNFVSLGGKLIRNNVECVMLGENAEVTINGLYLPQKNGSIDFFVSTNHIKPHCQSHQLFKSIVEADSRAMFNGRIYVDCYAQKTNAFQTNRNLLLSDKAWVHTQPQLEIFADDVKCSHGATCGNLDENQIFYLQTRGLNEKHAKSILSYAFANELVLKQKESIFHKEIHSRLLQKLNLKDL